ncbi:hypothetical protein DE146DRAFT_735019 [Phaeosphaeria sp. MPI-PUGE-AT-0046c]|nr:hypothetical protein DE146DRAFT_735019 [Phaeosphaeria sp. MPI-PUGE-AT-0046c]
MTTSASNHSVPSESDDEVDNADANLPPAHIWAYPCKLPLCPDYGKTWLLRSNFFFHLHEEDAHKATAMTPAARRAIEKEWRYATDPHLPPRAAPYFRSREDPDEHIWDYNFRDDTGKIISGRGTMRGMEMHKAARRRETQGKQTA